MIETELQTNSPNNPAVKDGVFKTESQAEIVKRLEYLNKWQEDQTKLLKIRQIKQRHMLDMEQQNMYEMLGLKTDSQTTLIGEEQRADAMGNFDSHDSVHTEEYVDETSDESMGSSPAEEETIQDENREPCCKTENLRAKVDTKVILKRPFLKRGEGLKQRFKIDPDELRLNNLPKYKYANAHPNLRLRPLKKFCKRGNVKKIAAKPANLINSEVKSTENLTYSDAQERRYQNVLKSFKTSCSSTPDIKSSFAKNKPEDGPEAESEKKQNNDAILSKEQPCYPYKAASTKVFAWSKILDPLEIKPLQVPRSGNQNRPQTEDSIFELLEQKAEEGSFDMDSSCLRDFMSNRYAKVANESDDIIPVQQHLANKRLEPVVSAKDLPEQQSILTSEDITESQYEVVEKNSSASSISTTQIPNETTTSSASQNTPKIRVRFSDSNETHEYEEDPEVSIDDTIHLTGGLSPKTDHDDETKNELFLQFKEALFAALSAKADQQRASEATLNALNESSITNKNLSASCSSIINEPNYTPACKDLQEKTETIKTRLSELEKEIKFFKENNLLLLKAKQENELQKSCNAQEHLEAMEKLKDEKIRMEIYLHDERVKLEDEKRQIEQKYKVKVQSLISKERKECEHLKGQINRLEIQLKTKDNNHTVAQSRLRTQLRNMEKEQQKLYEQIEHLTKENKRLENENLKISREQNNKILLEINRNIAKLAPKQQTSISPPAEGHSTTKSAPKTVSKCIVATATANKNSNKAHNSTKFSNAPQHIVKHCNSPIDVNTETIDEINFMAEEQQIPNLNLDEDENEHDVLKEFQITRNNNLSVKSPTNNNNIKTAQKSLSKGVSLQPSPPPPSSPRSRCVGINMKREISNPDGSKDIWYPNGNLKKISADGMVIRMLYYNKDIKETNINEGTVKYYYAETNTWHTSYLDGLEILEFPNGQIEHRHKNGAVEVHYPNNSVKIVNPKDEHKQEEWRFADGTHLVQMRNGDKILSLPNGQKEIHNKLHKRREYPDGTVKIVYPDGSAETRYSNGRVRLKDKDGRLVMDTEITN